MADRLEIDVLDAGGVRVGVLDQWTAFEARARFTDVGSWDLTLPSTAKNAELLQPRNKVAFVLDGEVFLSGPITAIEERGSGSIRASGPDDLAYLAYDVAYPQAPGVDLNNAEADVRSGPAEVLAAGYVSDNVGPTAAVDRRRVEVLQRSLPLGSVLNESARFESLVALTKRVLAFDGLGQRCRWNKVSGLPVWEVLESRDQTGTVQFSAVRDTLADYRVMREAPSATRAIVGGAGDGTARVFRQVTNPDTENEWGLRIVTFIDARDTADAQTLDVRGFQATPYVPVTIDATSIDTQGTQYGRDWRLGDRVQAVAGSVTAELLVTEVVATGAPLRVAPVLGSYDAIRWEALAAVREKALRLRLDALEARK